MQKSVGLNDFEFLYHFSLLNMTVHILQLLAIIRTIKRCSDFKNVRSHKASSIHLLSCKGKSCRVDVNKHMEFTFTITNYKQYFFRFSHIDISQVVIFLIIHLFRKVQFQSDCFHVVCVLLSCAWMIKVELVKVFGCCRPSGSQSCPEIISCSTQLLSEFI